MYNLIKTHKIEKLNFLGKNEKTEFSKKIIFKKNNFPKKTFSKKFLPARRPPRPPYQRLINSRGGRKIQRFFLGVAGPKNFPDRKKS